jgi:hypothetical protein
MSSASIMCASERILSSPSPALAPSALPPGGPGAPMVLLPVFAPVKSTRKSGNAPTCMGRSDVRALLRRCRRNVEGRLYPGRDRKDRRRKLPAHIWRGRRKVVQLDGNRHVGEADSRQPCIRQGDYRDKWLALRLSVSELAIMHQMTPTGPANPLCGITLHPWKGLFPREPLAR